MEGLAQVTPENLPFFLFSNPEIVPEAFNKKFQKNTRTFFGFAGLTLFGGVIMNMVATRVLPQMLILHPAVRFPLRFLILLSPLVGTYPKLAYHYDNHE